MRRNHRPHLEPFQPTSEAFKIGVWAAAASAIGVVLFLYWALFVPARMGLICEESAFQEAMGFQWTGGEIHSAPWSGTVHCVTSDGTEFVASIRGAVLVVYGTVAMIATGAFALTRR